MNTVTGQREMILVPRIPTEEMVDEAWAEALGEDAVGVWKSMIATWERSLVKAGGNLTEEAVRAHREKRTQESGS